MNKEQLRSILSDKYDLASWRQVLTEVFGATGLFQQPKPITLPANDLAESSSELGSFKTSDDRLVGLYQVDLKDSVRIGQNRVGLRKLLRNIYKYDVDAALVVFVQNDKWRLSLISEIRVRNPETDEVIEQRTEPKRFTYLLGEGETVRTSVDRLDLFRESDSTLRSLIDAFSVEKLNKDFFRDYKAVFAAFEAEVGRSIQDTETARLFTQSLLNRLMFLYFIQKKGWMKFEGNENYLRSVFDRAIASNENFYRDRLYWIFFYGLSNQAESFEIQENSFLVERRGEVPYLNGGLFEMEKDGNDEKGKVSISNERFAELLKLFEAYNFTIDESTPFEVQVAVDPEMLGKVFEELVTGRHESGSYYTPRTVVSFMCREALKHALANCDTPESIAKLVDESDGKDIRNPQEVLNLLRSIRACDPACGSGAYLLGMLQEMLHVREALFASEKVAPDAQYEWKREIIENSIYGVDLDRFATQIASLRLWLSLAIESDEPKPLPNLKYKIGCGDSLLAPIETIGQGDLHRRALIEQFRARKKEYIDADNHSEKSEAESEIERLRVEIARTLQHLPEPPKPAEIPLAERDVQPLKEKIDRLVKLGDKGQAEKFQKQLDQLLAHIAKLKESVAVESYDTGNVFDWSVEFAEVFQDGGFDIVLANPPYLQLQASGGKLARLYENKGFETFARTGDIYSLFYERGVQLLKEHGVLSYITSNKWMRAKYGEKTRKFLAEKTKPLLIVDFGSVEVFSSATVDNNILILEKSRSDESQLFAARTEIGFDISQNIQNYIRDNGYFLSTVNQNSWIIGEKDEFDIKGKVEAQGIPLEHDSWKIRINYGIKTGLNEAFIIGADTRRSIKEKAERNSDDRSLDLLKPLLRGKDIKAWFPEYSDLFLIATFPTLNLNIERYPAVRDYLLGIGKHRLEQSGNPGSRKKTGNRWFETQDQISYWRDFEKPKIIYPNMTKYLPFIYDEAGFYTNDKAFIIIGDSLKYLTCFFNSKLFKYCFSNNFPNLGEDRRELRKVFFEKIPVKQLSVEDQKVFDRLVEYIAFLRCRVSKTRKNGGGRPDELIKSALFEQLSDALILETYLADEFERYGVSIRSSVGELPEIGGINDDSLDLIDYVFTQLDDFRHPLRTNLSGMKSIPAIQMIYNAVRN